MTGYPGARLGLPETGAGSIARPGRRLAAISIDWIVALLLVRLFLPELEYGSPAYGVATLAFFAASVGLFTWIAGSSFGQRILGMQVARIPATTVGPARALGRTGLLCLVIPAVIWDRDQRGLHDRWMGTVLLRSKN